MADPTGVSALRADSIAEAAVERARARGFAEDALDTLRDLVRDAALAARGLPESERDECDFYASLFEDLPVPVWRTDEHGDLRYANKAWLTFTGRALDEERGDGWLAGVPEDDRAALRRAIAEAVRARRGFRFEYHLHRHDGALRYVETQASPIRGPGGRFDGLIGWTTDTTEHRQQEAQLAFMATHDPLTGLPNRRMLEEPLKRAVARARRGTPSALLLLDLDNFKYYNDALGHLEGDQALINLSLLLQTHIRAGDLLVRLGGDEFAVLLEGATPDEALDIAERMRATASGEFVPRARDFGLSISLGLLEIDGRMDHRRLLGYADQAMYRAKEAGRNRIALYTPRDSGEQAPSDSAAVRIREAFRRDSFVLHFQPVVRLGDTGVEYYEALLRMGLDDGKAGALSPPAEFLPSAQRFGLMPKITRWVVDNVVAELQTDSDSRISVNLSALDLTDAQLPDDVAARLASADVRPDRLLFEVSEPDVSQDLATAEKFLGRLARVGCRLVLEDFGRAFTSLGMLKGLPFDHVKVDCSLIGSFEDAPGHIALLSAVRTLAASQGKQVVAECVSSEQELDFARKAGFSLAQGIHLGRPSPARYPVIR